MNRSLTLFILSSNKLRFFPQNFLYVNSKMWTFNYKMSDVKLAEGCNDNCLENLRQILNGGFENAEY